jgi:hypothetical protein
MSKPIVKYSVVKISTDIIKDNNIKAPEQTQVPPNTHQTKIPIMVFLWSSWMGNQVSCITYSFDKGGNIHYLMDTIDGNSIEEVIKKYYPEIKDFKLSTITSVVEMRKSLQSDLEIDNIHFFFGRTKYEGAGAESTFNKNHLVSYLVDCMINSFPISQFNDRFKTESKGYRSKARQLEQVKKNNGGVIPDNVSVASGASNFSGVTADTTGTDGVVVPDDDVEKSSSEEIQQNIDEYKDK